jgi:hypothetical protein
MHVDWTKCQGGVWCNFLTVNMDHSYFDKFSGVYIVWRGNPNPATVYVGTGVVRDRVKLLRADTRILQYRSYGLFVTTASVVTTMQAGVQAYLISTLKPLVQDQLPAVELMQVNLPW